MSKSVLVVEDNAMNMQLFTDLLKSRDYDVIQSPDGTDCLDLAREHKPGLIVMDIQLPGHSGLDYARELKADAELKHIPVLAVTAFDLEGGLERIFETGCDDMLGKPIDTQEFLRIVERYF